MPGELNTANIRFTRRPEQEDESSLSSPSTDTDATFSDLEAGENGGGYQHDGNGRSVTQSSLDEIFLDDTTSKHPLLQSTSEQKSSWARRRRIPFFGRWLRRGRRVSTSGLERSACRRKTPGALRALLKCISVILMIL